MKKERYLFKSSKFVDKHAVKVRVAFSAKDIKKEKQSVVYQSKINTADTTD